MIKYLVLLIIFVNISAFAETPATQEKFANLEKTSNLKVGVYAVNTHNHEIINYRADDRFPVQSTLKLLGVSALLKKK